MKILVTGAAGFIGYHLSKRLVDDGHHVVGLDEVNAYYDIDLKFARLENLGIDRYKIVADNLVAADRPEFSFIRTKLESEEIIGQLFRDEQFDAVVNLAAQAGVRHSLSHPHDYIQSNVVGFLNVLEGCRHHDVKHLLYASSSSVYGLNKKMPLATTDPVDHPISLYAATKRSNELMAHSYSHLYGLPTTGLRFFTVYGPWGRPDMALFIFTKAILEGKPIRVFNQGEMVRDFTYVDDIVEGIVRLILHRPNADDEWNSVSAGPDSSSAPWHIFNIGNNSEVRLMDFVHAIEDALGQKAEVILESIQPGDVAMTKADVSGLIKAVGYNPSTLVEEGINNFVSWYRKYYRQ